MVSFNTAIVVMTSAGAGLIPNPQQTSDILMRRLRTFLRPELFLNRVDETVVLYSLGDDKLRELAELLLETLRKTAANRDVDLHSSDAAQRIASEGRVSRLGDPYAAR